MRSKSSASKKALIIEDDRALPDGLKDDLSKEGFEVISSRNVIEAFGFIRSESPDIIILNLDRQQMGGVETCRGLRNETTIPILMHSSSDDEVDRVACLNIGADDYMSKPFSSLELMARVRALIRRSDISVKELIKTRTDVSVGNIEINTAAHRVTFKGEPLKLTPKEFNLLLLLAINRGRVFSREQIMKTVWNRKYSGNTRTVDVHVKYLRKKIESNPIHPSSIITVRGIGYKME